jgi:RNA polymerase sigma-70 factor (ECF subfamily)
LQDRGEAEDVLQEVFVEIWQRAERYNPARGAPRNYLLLLARSRSLDRCRSRKSRTGQAEETAAGGPTADVQLAVDSRAASPVASAAAGEARQVVAAALRQLDAPERRAVELAFYGGLSHSEIAAQLNLPLGTIKTRIRQGLVRLRDALRAYYDSGRESGL